MFPVADDIDPAVSDGNPVAGSPVKQGAGRGEDGDFTVEALGMDDPVLDIYPALVWLAVFVGSAGIPVGQEVEADRFQSGTSKASGIAGGVGVGNFLLGEGQEVPDAGATLPVRGLGRVEAG